MITKLLPEISKQEINAKTKPQSDLTKIFQDSDYIQKNIEAFQHLRSRDYQNAKNSYKESVAISRDLDDDYKFSDSLANYGVCQFFCGNIKDAVESLESAYRVAVRWQNMYDKPKMILYLKILSNLSLTFLALGKPSEALSYINIIIEAIQKEKENSYTTKLFYMKQVLHIFFRVESIVNYVQIYHKYNFDMKEKTVVSNENTDLEEIHGVIINRILFFLHKYLREHDLDAWIKCLNEEAENFKIIKDYNGFVFALFNQHAALYLKNPEENKNAAKIKISSLTKVLIGDKDKKEIEEKSTEKILNEMREKMMISIEIYRKLYDFELLLLSSIQDASNDISICDTSGINIKAGSNSKIFVKLFLRHALRSLSKLEGEKGDDNLNNLNNTNNTNDVNIRQMKMQINFTLGLIEKDQIDLKSLGLFKIDPDITNSLNILFENILYIRYKCKLRKYFKELMFETLGYRTREDLRFIKDKKIESWLNKNYTTICKGSILIKINFSTSGKKEHFYKFEPDLKAIRVYQKKNDKSFKTLLFDDINKFNYGISSGNLKKRFKSMQSSQLNAPWLFFSIIMKKRSIDLYLEENQLINWFYGIKKYLKDTEKDYKMISVHNFVLTKTKLRLMQKLKEEYSNKMEDKYKEVVQGILQGKNRLFNNIKIKEYKLFHLLKFSCFI